MKNLEYEKEMIFVKLIRKGPHILEFSNDYLMVHNGKITIATSTILEHYNAAKRVGNMELKHNLIRSIAELIDNEYYRNRSIEWYSLRDYIGNFDGRRLEELKEKIYYS
jgi:hypothetical protein